MELDIFYGKGRFAFQAFILEAFIEVVEELVAEVNEYSS